MSNVEVDQSGRIEMSGETTIAVSNGFTVTVRVIARVKQEVRQALLEQGIKPRMVMIRMFVGAILLAIRDHLKQIDLLTIDEEYTGYEATIKSLLLDRIRALGYEFHRVQLLLSPTASPIPRVPRNLAVSMEIYHRH
jgi:hypothetical protein